MQNSDRVAFTCNGTPVEVEVTDGESLLSVLRDRLGLVSVKDGCAPQGQCGCCTVLVDGDARVACVTPATRVAGRAVATVEGLDADMRDRLVDAFVATGGSQCGFCTPGILVRAAALLSKGRTTRAAIDRGLAAHLCRCTGWCTVQDAIEAAAVEMPSPAGAARLRRRGAAGRARGRSPQHVGRDVPLGAAGFADDGAPRDALVAVPCPPGSHAESVDAAGLAWVVGESLLDARARAAKVQGRRTTVDEQPPLELPALPIGGVRLATGWVEPAYLEPDASWCAPGGEPATPLACGGAFGGKTASPAPRAARELADQLGRTVRVLFAREDVVRLGPKRPPMAASAVLDGDVVRIAGTVAGPLGPFTAPLEWPYRLREEATWSSVVVPGPPVGIDAAPSGWRNGRCSSKVRSRRRVPNGAELLSDDRAGGVLLDTCAPAPGGAVAGRACTSIPTTGAIQRVDVRVAAGDVLDEVVLRSYCIGAAHMALGWVLSEGLTVDRARARCSTSPSGRSGCSGRRTHRRSR